MMISHRDSKRSYFKYIVSILCIGVVLFFWSFIQRVSIGLFEITQIESSRIYIRIQDFFYGVKMYTKSNEALYAELRDSQDLLLIEQQKNFQLRAAEDSIKKYETFAISPAPVVFARRIGAVDSFLSESFRINIGINAPCIVGDTVISPKNIFIGTISNIDSRTSNVLMAWAGEDILARLNTNGTTLILKGNSDGTYTAHVPRTVTIERGSLLALDSNPNIIVGSVIDINTNDTESFVIVTIGVGFSPNFIDRVAVICTPQ